MQATLFAPEPTTPSYADAVGCTFNHRGTEGVIVAYDTETYAEPMFIVRFESGRAGVLRPTELGSLGVESGTVQYTEDGSGNRTYGAR